MKSKFNKKTITSKNYIDFQKIKNNYKNFLLWEETINRSYKDKIISLQKKIKYIFRKTKFYNKGLRTKKNNCFKRQNI